MTLQCRTCSSVIYNTKAKNLFHIENAKMLLNISLICGAMLQNDPDLPSCICACCILDLNQAIVFRERCIQTQEDLLEQLSNREQEVQEPATDPEEEKDVEIKEEVDVGKLVLPLPPDELDDPFEEVEEYEYFEDFQDVDGLVEANDVEVGEEVAHDADSLISSVQKEFESIYNDESVDDNNEFDEDPTNCDELEDESDGFSQDSTQPKPKRRRGSSKVSGVSTDTPSTPPKRKKQYVTWKNLTADQMIERKRQQRKRDCVCEQCGRHFTDQSNFKMHMLRHTGMKNFACQECGKRFYTDHLMSLHQRIVHQGEKPYACRFCTKSFHNSTTRVIHERGHTNAKPYTCHHCDKSFSSASGRKRHELIHTGVRAFSCTICEQTFQRNTHLKAHLQSKFHIVKARVHEEQQAQE
ncbi:transcription factor Ouib [Drosophila biarmipes]|uniref:transcription factor Ouib n=1 Tax=Drosophila biarmipes TaxID=125945 RepID=UPI0007E87048|nr:transcription factor Ouib [Drosophila biarmipes]